MAYATVTTAFIMTVIPTMVHANDWNKTKDDTTTSSSSGTTDYYHLGLGWHATWQRSNGAWTDGEPGSNQSQTLTVDVQRLADNLGIGNKNILNAFFKE